MERVIEEVGKNHNVVKKWCNFLCLVVFVRVSRRRVSVSLRVYGKDLFQCKKG